MSQTLMVQGTSSDAGKSTLVTGLCRILYRRGFRVVPFKPQNMSLNSAVTRDGGEIGRAQALQAQAAGLEPTTDMNPILLKPTTNVGAQIIIHGHAIGTMGARDYHDYKRIAREAVLESYARLAAQYDFVLVEGAGSPAEINLRTGDIANMGFAEAVDCPVVLIADIDRGGVFAQITGTLALLSESERERVKGFVINRFRGDLELLRPGLTWLEQHSAKPVFGVLPYLPALHLDAEDGISRELQPVTGSEALNVVVPRLPRISNHTDFEPLRADPQIRLEYVTEPPRGADLVILPGSKAVRDDLAWLIARGWTDYLRRHLRYGGRLLGICGGFQMLGEVIADPDGLEGVPGRSAGLGLLGIETVLLREKQLKNVSGRLLLGNVRVRGYEIHAGRSTGPALDGPAVVLDDGRPDGAVSADGQIIGTYIHGIFEDPHACAALLGWAALCKPAPLDHAQRREIAIDRIASAIEASVNVDQVLGSLVAANPSSAPRTINA